MASLAPVGPVYQAGTLSGNPLAVAAGLATLRAATPEVYATVDAAPSRSPRLAADALTEAGRRPLVLNNAGSLFSIFFTDDARSSTTRRRRARRSPRYAAFFHSMLDAGVYLPPSAYEAWFPPRRTTRRRSNASRPRCRPPPRPRPRCRSASPTCRDCGATDARACRQRAARTTVHLVRHGEVHNPTKVLYGRLPGFRLSDAGLAAGEGHLRQFLATRPRPRHRRRHRSARWSGPSRPPPRSREQFGLEVGIDPRLIESEQQLRGRRGRGRPEDPAPPAAVARAAQPVPPVVGRGRTRRSPPACSPRSQDARPPSRGREAVLVSHQLPIYVTRRAAEGRPLWHRPDRRQCALASVTSLVFAETGARPTVSCAGVDYCEPNGPGKTSRARSAPDAPAEARSAAAQYCTSVADPPPRGGADATQGAPGVGGARPRRARPDGGGPSVLRPAPARAPRRPRPARPGRPVTAFGAWLEQPAAGPEVTAGVFAAAPRELVRAVSLQQTVEMVRSPSTSSRSTSTSCAEPGRRPLATRGDAPLHARARVRRGAGLRLRGRGAGRLGRPARGAGRRRAAPRRRGETGRCSGSCSVAQRRWAGVAANASSPWPGARPGRRARAEARRAPPRRPGARVDVLAGVHGNDLVSLRRQPGRSAGRCSASCSACFGTGPLVLGPGGDRAVGRRRRRPRRRVGALRVGARLAGGAPPGVGAGAARRARAGRRAGGRATSWSRGLRAARRRRRGAARHRLGLRRGRPAPSTAPPGCCSCTPTRCGTGCVASPSSPVCLRPTRGTDSSCGSPLSKGGCDRRSVCKTLGSDCRKPTKARRDLVEPSTRSTGQSPGG